jgi:hypothetical protein
MRSSKGTGPGKKSYTPTRLSRVPRPSFAWAGFLTFTRRRLNPQTKIPLSNAVGIEALFNRLAKSTS